VYIIAKSFDIFEGPIGVPPTMSANDRRILAAAFEGIKDTSALQSAGIGGFVAGSDHDYDSIRQLITTLNIDISKLVS
jgi:hypothetical protein